MAKYHEIDAPDLQLDSSPIADNSALSFLYPDPKRDTRPLLKSDAERHRLQAERIHRAVEPVLKHGVLIAFLFAAPFMYAVILVAFVLELAQAQAVGPLIAVLVIGSAFGLGILVGALKHATEQLHRFGVSGLGVGLTTICMLFIGGGASSQLIPLTASTLVNSYILSGILAGISLITVYILLGIAVWSYRRHAGQN